MKKTETRSGDQPTKEISELRKRVAELEDWKAEHICIEASLRESESMFKKLVERAVAGVYVIQNGKLMYVNQALADILGYDASELVGKFAKIPIFAEDWPMIEENLNKRLTGEVGTINYQFRGVRKDGTVIWLEVYGSTMEYKGCPAIIGTVTDITDRVQTQQEVLLERQRLEILSEHAPYGLAMISNEGEFKYVNPKFKELFGYDLQDIPNGKQWFRMAFPNPAKRRTAISAWLADIEKVRAGKPRPRTFEIVCKNGLKKMVRFIPVQLDDGDHLMTCEDITDRKKAEDELRESERKYKDLFNGAPIGIFQSTIEGRVLSVNPAYVEMYRYTSAEEAALEIDNVAERTYVEPERRKMLIDLALKTDGFVKAENEYRRKDGSQFWGQVYFRVVRDSDGEVKHLEGFVEDITDRKRSEQQIKTSLEEKEVLLREINHRVKNNLQVISSLVRLQARQVTAESCSHALQETQNRLQTIGLIHEMLHQSRNLAYIDVEGYLKRLIANLFSLYGAKSSRIEITVDAQELRLGVDKADPLGLIANELVSNCLKHAFPGGIEGIIRISFALASNEFELMVSDNGVGLREDFDPINAQTLGLVLVNTLVKQLHGDMTVIRSAGTEFLIRFPVSTS